MPTKKVAEKRRTEEATAKDPYVRTNLRPYNVVLKVLLSQLSMIPYFTMGILRLDMATTTMLTVALGLHRVNGSERLDQPRRLPSRHLQFLHTVAHTWSHLASARSCCLWLRNPPHPTFNVLDITFVRLFSTGLDSNAYMPTS